MEAYLRWPWRWEWPSQCRDRGARTECKPTCDDGEDKSGRPNDEIVVQERVAEGDVDSVEHGALGRPLCPPPGCRPRDHHPPQQTADAQRGQHADGKGGQGGVGGDQRWRTKLRNMTSELGYYLYLSRKHRRPTVKSPRKSQKVKIKFFYCNFWTKRDITKR